MADAHDTIYWALVNHPHRRDMTINGYAIASIEALERAGYRILGPDELDPVTLKKAARIADDRGTRAKTMDGQRTGISIAATIRTLVRRA